MNINNKFNKDKVKHLEIKGKEKKKFEFKFFGKSIKLTWWF